MADLFGAPVGISAAIGDVRQLGELAMQPGRLAMQPDQARLLKAQAGIEEMKLQEEQRYAGALSAAAAGGTGGPAGGSMADQIGRLAELTLSAGAPNKAMKLITEYSALKGHEAQLLAANARTALAEAQMTKIKSQWVASHLMDATDPQSWQQTNADYEATFKEPSPYKVQPYSPELVNRLQNGALTVKERMDLRIKELNRQSLEASRKSTEQHQRTMERYDAVKAQAAATRAKVAEEQAGGRMPPAGYTAEAVDLLTHDYIDMEPNEARSKGRQVAERAQELIRHNRGLKPTEAVASAYLNMQQEGAFNDYAKIPVKGVKGDASQKALAEKYGQTYDPVYEYREVNGHLQRRKR